jgi:hypothetical protein
VGDGVARGLGEAVGAAVPEDVSAVAVGSAGIVLDTAQAVKSNPAMDLVSRTTR